LHVHTHLSMCSAPLPICSGALFARAHAPQHVQRAPPHLLWGATCTCTRTSACAARPSPSALGRYLHVHTHLSMCSAPLPICSGALLARAHAPQHVQRAPPHLLWGAICTCTRTSACAARPSPSALGRYLHVHTHLVWSKDLREHLRQYSPQLQVCVRDGQVPTLLIAHWARVGATRLRTHDKQTVPAATHPTHPHTRVQS
jgi:hypothetical protein